MKQLVISLLLMMTLFAMSSFAQTLTSESDKDGYYQFSWYEAAIDSGGADTSGTIYFNTYLTGSSTITNPFSYWYSLTVAATGAAADSVSTLLIIDAYHNTTWAALDTITLDVSGTSTSGVQLMNLNNWRSPDNKYRIRAVQNDGGSAITAFKTAGIVIRPAQ